MSGLTKIEVKERVCAAIEKAMPRLMEIAETIMAAPELGYKENKQRPLYSSCLQS